MPDLAQVKGWAVADAKGTASEEVSTWLRGEGLDDWRKAIGSVIHDVDADMAIRRAHVQEVKEGGWSPEAYRQAKSEYERWKGQAAKFKAHMVARSAEAKSLMHSHNYGEDDAKLLLADMADLLDELCERGVLDAHDTKRADALIDRVPAWLDGVVEAILRTRENAA